MGKRAADRRATAKAKAKASSSAAAEAQPPDGKLPLPTNMCRPMLQKLHDAISAIKSHAIFQDITTALPLGISDGGSQAAFSQSTFDTALTASGCYTAAANFFWQNMGWFPNAKLPVNPGQVAEIQRFKFDPLNPPRSLGFTVVVAVDGAMDIMAARGSRQRLSPVEPMIAFIFSLKDAVQQGASDEILMKWRHVALTAPFQFEVVAEGEDRYWRAANIRQECIEAGDVVQLSTRQWIFDVIGFKEGKERQLGRQLSAAAVAKLYEDHMHYARSSEQVKDSFIE